MEGYSNPVMWSYQPNLPYDNVHRGNSQTQTTVSYFNSDSLNTNTSDSRQRGVHSVSPYKNPLKVDFNELNGKSRFDYVNDSIEKTERLRGRNFGNNSEQQNQTLMTQNNSTDKYTMLLHQMRPSQDLIQDAEPLARQLTSNTSTFSQKYRSQPDLRRQPAKSVLIPSASLKPRLSKQKTVGFTDNNDVIEVENWKIYNVDMAKKAKEDRRANDGTFCAIF